MQKRAKKTFECGTKSDRFFVKSTRVYNIFREICDGDQFMKKDISRCESLANACNSSLYEDALSSGTADPVRAFIFWE